MEQIILDELLPKVFEGEDHRNHPSGVWQHKLTFSTHESILLEAASGTGKSSLLSFLYGYRTDYSGELRFDNRVVRDFTQKDWLHIRRQELSLLFQELKLFPELTAWENIQLKNQLTHHLKPVEIEEMMERLGIMGHRNQKAATLSWGQQQRVALIRALAQPFNFLLLDEPVSHIDPHNSQAMSELVKEQIKQRGAGVIVTSIGKALPLTYNHTFTL